MKLETKLNISTGILVLAMFASAAISHWRLSGVIRLTNEIATQRGPFISDLDLLDQDVSASVLSLQSSILEGSNAEGCAIDEANGHAARKRVGDDVTRLQQLSHSFSLGSDKGKLPDILFRLEELERLEAEVESKTLNGGSDAEKASLELLQSVVPLQTDTSAMIGTMLLNERAQRSDAMQLLNVGNRQVVFTLWIATVLGALIGGALSVFLARRLTGAIDLLVKRAAAIASGDLTGTELGVHSCDQIGALALGMQSMQTGLAAIIGTVASTAGTLSSNAVSMRAASDQMHRRIDQQAQQTQQAATAMQEMSASIAEVSRHTQSAAETARSAAQTAREGGSIVKQMLGSMHSIASAVTETSNTVGLLGEDSRRISQIVTVIDEIARKTNLLALNAAIEAARAGEQGRGFAVVASEVRRLAETTAQATGEIASMIQGIQDRTRTAIASMASGTGTVQEGVVTTNQAGEALERIIGMADRVDRMITQIAIAASQQATAADQSSASLDSIHSLSNENLNEMSTTKAGIESMRGTVVRLEKQVDRFQVALA